jgi:hypothetical protein
VRAFIPYTKDYSEMAQEAGRRMLEFSGISSMDYLSCKTSKDCHRLKLEAWLEYCEPVVMGDADLWILRESHLPVPLGSMVYGAPNDSGVELYSGSPVPPRSALCSALVGMDMRSEGCAKAVQQAIKLQKRDYARDEVYLNLALFSQAELCVMRLSNYWNWCGPPVPLTIGLHAAGRADKMAWLRQNAG